MKYLKILPLSLVASLLSQDAMALREDTIQQARVEGKRQRAEGAQNATLAGLGLPQNVNNRAALTALAAGGVGVNANNVRAADALLGVPLAVNANNIAATVALLAGGVAVNANHVAAADEIIRNAGGAGQVNAANVVAADALLGVPLGVNANNVAAAVALENANGDAIAINQANVDAAILLNPYIVGGNQLTAPQIAAVIIAIVINNNTRDAVVWAITNGFGAQAVGTVPVGVAEVTGIAGNDHTLTVRYGNAAIPFGANAGKFAGNDFHVHLNQLPVGTAIGHFLVFSAAADDIGAAFITLTDHAKAN